MIGRFVLLCVCRWDKKSIYKSVGGKKSRPHKSIRETVISSDKHALLSVNTTWTWRPNYSFKATCMAFSRYLSLCNKTIRLKRKVKKNKKTNSLKINWEIESKREKVILSFIESLFELWSSQKHATFIQILSLFRSERVTNFIYVKNTTSKYQLAVKT